MAKLFELKTSKSKSEMGQKGVEAWWGFLAGAIIVIVVVILVVLLYSQIKGGSQNVLSSLITKLGDWFK